MQKSLYSYTSFIQRLNEGQSGEIPSPDFTPHEEFHKYRWMKPQEGDWYYKMKDFKPCILPKNKDFNSSLDPELQEVVSFLHAKKIPTTPSCAGHFCNPSEWEERYDQLEKDADLVRSQGLMIKDPEDNFSYCMKDPTYSLPWNKKAFIERANEHAKFGVIGIYDPGNFFAKKITRSNIPNSQVKKDGALTLFLTSPRSKHQLSECWNRFTESIIRNPLS